MKSLQHILNEGNSAADKGAPLISNWPQVRASLQMLGQIISLDQIPATQFGQMFPENYETLDHNQKDAFGSKRLYYAIRREISKILALQGVQEDSWISLGTLLRAEGNKIASHNLSYIARAAKSKGLLPSEVTPDWIWSYDRELGPSRSRNLFRQGVFMFDTLFEHPKLRWSGVLPDNRPGPPPEYDRLGQPRSKLPDTLACVKTKRRELEWVWHAICISDSVQLPINPTPMDLVNAWPAIKNIAPKIVGIAQKTWRNYLNGALRYLKAHEGLTDRGILRSLTTVYANSSKPQKAAIREFERRLLSLEDETLRNAPLIELIAPRTWYRIWESHPQKFLLKKETKSETLFRAACLRYDKTLPVPSRSVFAPPPFVEEVASNSSKHAAWGIRVFWRKLISLEEQELREAPINALLAPATWERIWFTSPLQLSHASERCCRPAARKALLNAIEPNPVINAWDELYAQITDGAYLTKDYPNLWYIRSEAIKASLPPSSITQSWLEKLRDTCPGQRLTNLYGGVEDLRKISGYMHLSPLTKRRQKHSGLPRLLEIELEGLMRLMGASKTTQKQMKLSVGIFSDRLNLGEKTCLADILEADWSKVEWNSAMAQEKTYLKKIESLQKFRNLNWTPEWRSLQEIAAGAGIGLLNNPIPKILARNPGNTPKSVTIEWAKQVDRELRSTLTNPPHGRADLALTFARHLSAFDKLHDIPQIRDAGLMPHFLGKIR